MIEGYHVWLERMAAINHQGPMPYLGRGVNTAKILGRGIWKRIKRTHNQSSKWTK